MRNESRISRCFAVALIGLFMNFVFVNSVFTHTHRLADGSVMSHSHPYQHSQTHSHCSSILSLISAFNAAAAAFQGVAAVILAAIASAVATLYICRTPRRLQNPQYDLASLRAPPVLN